VGKRTRSHRQQLWSAVSSGNTPRPANEVRFLGAVAREEDLVKSTHRHQQTKQKKKVPSASAFGLDEARAQRRKIRCCSTCSAAPPGKNEGCFHQATKALARCTRTVPENRQTTLPSIYVSCIYVYEPDRFTPSTFQLIGIQRPPTHPYP
jgi:hypothetical protein